MIIVALALYSTCWKSASKWNNTMAGHHCEGRLAGDVYYHAIFCLYIRKSGQIMKAFSYYDERLISYDWIKCCLSVWDAASTDKMCTNKKFYKHFFILGLVFGVQMVCLLDFSFILAVTFRRVTCQYLSRTKKNQLNWRFVVLHLESGESSATWYIWDFSKGGLCGIPSFAPLKPTNTHHADHKDDEICLNFDRQLCPFVQPVAVSIDSPQLITPNA